MDIEVQLSEIRFVRPRQCNDIWGDRGLLVTLDVKKVDRAWRYPNRIPRSGGPDPDSRLQYEQARQWLGVARKVELRATTVTREDDDALCLVEGRHSFAVLRDLGYATIEAWVNRDEADELVQKYGPDGAKSTGSTKVRTLTIHGESNPKPCPSCGQMMYAELRNIHVFWKKQKCCHHCGVTHGKEHSHYCSTADGLRYRGAHQVYLPGPGFIPLGVACAGGKRPAQNVGLFLVQE